MMLFEIAFLPWERQILSFPTDVLKNARIFLVPGW